MGLTNLTTEELPNFIVGSTLELMILFLGIAIGCIIGSLGGRIGTLIGGTIGAFVSLIFIAITSI